jgi:hypothetical protein
MIGEVYGWASVFDFRREEQALEKTAKAPCSEIEYGYIFTDPYVGRVHTKI